MFKLLFFISFSFLIITGCSKPSSKPIIEPKWLYKPNLNSNTGAVGSSKPHFKGKTMQRRVAISRALDELAQQKGVEISNIIMRNEKNSGARVSSSTTIKSIQESSSTHIRAHIEEIWIDPRNKELYVWLIAN